MEDWRKKLVEIIRAEKTPCCTEATAKTQRSVESAESKWMDDVRKAFDNLGFRLRHVAIVNHVKRDNGERMQWLLVNVKGCEGDQELILEYKIEVSIDGPVSNRQRVYRCADGRSDRCHGPVSIPNAWTVNDIIEDMAQCIERADG